MRIFPTDVSTLARFLVSDECSSIAILTGAGVSVSSGIPDFRSPGGFYDQLRPELITASPRQHRLMSFDPSFVVSWDVFQESAFPYLEVRRPFILGTEQHQWKATLAHRFFQVLHERTGKLTRIYTQNIDGLDFQTQIPASKIIPVHGSIANVSCEGCGDTNMSFSEFCGHVRTNIKDIYAIDKTAPAESKPIACTSCGRPMLKPTTVLFGRSLPMEFFECAQIDMPAVDCLIVAGTSLMVSPANSLVQMVSPQTVRVVVNRETVGEHLGLDFAGKDLFLQGDCDEVFLQIAQELGWIKDLQNYVEDMPESASSLLK